MIIKKIKKDFVKKCKLLKSKSLKPYAEEFTVFIKVKIANLNELSKLISCLLYTSDAADE